ncbi:peptidase M28 [Streptomyces sp. NWU339]|uniref:M20/M25/M40 family metallo-hydrolase n=1 Tax=Streptomyces sp. NWU339 TaxID=2185284 RepID=UPI000D674FE6|nr:M20/M25/M40 family metallo-hydrolase [Streptomyces sp. NWU339]PWI05791.1 peptidase M28 [Streptomyces sp. NWU339]
MTSASGTRPRAGSEAESRPVQETGARRPRRTGYTLFAVLAFLAVLGTLSVSTLSPPAARGTVAPASEFSAARATGHLREIARAPHPVGTAEHTRVREYIVATATELGADVRVQSGGAVQAGMGSPFASATVHNVIARLPGREGAGGPGEALLLVAHYDSVPGSPGAADNGAAAASMLETLRAVEASGGTRHDVVFLFTDGEELGALGAELFVREEGVEAYGAVLNWEARGSGGPVVTFETAQGGLPLVKALATASSRPVANSLAYEVYKRLPNDSDFTVFRGHGAIGMNSAFIDGFHAYHSASDTIEQLDKDSVQHHGETMLGMVRVLDTAGPGGPRGEDGVYFDLFARLLVHYPVSWAAPLAGLTVTGLAALLWLGIRRAALRPRKVLRAAGTALGAVLAAGVLVHGMWTAALLLLPNLAALPLSEPYNRGWFLTAFAVAAGAVLLAFARLLRGLRPAETAAGVLVPTGLLLAVLAALLPGATYLVQWPLLVSLPALWWACRGSRGNDPAWGEPVGVVLWGFGPAVAVVLFAPLTVILLAAVGVPLAAAAFALAAFGALWLLPLSARLTGTGRSAVVAAAVALGLLTVSVLGHGFDAERPRPESLLYVRDEVEGTALWFSADPAPGDWNREVLGENPRRAPVKEYFPPRGDEPAMIADAPALDLPAPTVDVVEDATHGKTRTVRFRVASQRAAWRLSVHLPRAPLAACTTAGTRLGRKVLAEQSKGAADIVLEQYGDTNGFDISCDIPAGTRLEVDVADYTFGLTPEVRELVGPRPRGTVPVSYGFAPEDSVIVRRAEGI